MNVRAIGSRSQREMYPARDRRPVVDTAYWQFLAKYWRSASVAAA